jgi:hypothetical protein
MTSAERYRVKAAECEAWARRETSVTLRNQWDGMAKAYRRLAQLADRNVSLDLVYETPPRAQPMPQPQSKRGQPGGA